MTVEQKRALEQLPGAVVVARNDLSGVIVRLDGRLFTLSPSGLLTRFK